MVSQLLSGRSRSMVHLTGWLLVFFSTLYQLVENRRVLELQHRTLEARHTQAQLDYLKAQINPHFLFNALHNIYAAARLQHPRTADIVLRLSDLLRYVTYDAQATQVPLEKEVAQMNACLKLYQMKSTAVLPIYFITEGDLATRSIEPLLLLPFVENALKHGDLELNNAAFLRITLHNEPGRLVFTVENSFNPDDRQKESVQKSVAHLDSTIDNQLFIKGVPHLTEHSRQKDSATSGVGLENVRQRLELHYPRRHHLEVGAVENTFLARLKLQYIV